MFALRSTVEKLQKELAELRERLEDSRTKHHALMRQWNEVVEKINARGGQQFLDSAPTSIFSQEEIKTLLKFCHPDRHNGSQQATDITIKLSKLRIKNGPAR